MLPQLDTYSTVAAAAAIALGTLVAPTPSQAPTPTPNPVPTQSSLVPAVTGSDAPEALLASASGRTWSIKPGQSWTSAIAKAASGDVIELAAGRYDAQALIGVRGHGVIIRGASRTGTVVQGVYLNDSSGITFSNFTAVSASTGSNSVLRVTNASHDVVFDSLTVLPKDDPDGRSGFDVYSNSGSSLPPYDITLSNSLVDGSAATGTAARGVRIYGGEASETTWPHDITVHHNEIRNVDADLIQIGGARNLTIADNQLHDPHENADHNDGIQSYGSRNLVITGNRIWAAGAKGGPDQGIIIGHAVGKKYLKVNQTKIENNLVVGWRGQGITIAGANTTLLRQNTSVDNGGSSLVVGTAGSVKNTMLTVSNNIFDRIYRVDRGTLAYEDYNLVISPTGDPRGKHTRAGDAGFAERLNYTLAPTSRAINAGNRTTGVGWDYRGTERSTLDIGAREHHPSTGAIQAAASYLWGATFHP